MKTKALNNENSAGSNAKIVYGSSNPGKTLAQENRGSIGSELFFVQTRKTKYDNDDLFLSTGKSYRKVFLSARKNKADALILVGNNSRKLGVAVKFEKRYKFLDANQLSVLYLNYILSNSSNVGELSNDDFIVSSYASGELPGLLAESFGVKSFFCKTDEETIEEMIEKNNGRQPIFISDDSRDFLSNIETHEHQIEELSKMIKYYKDMNTSPYGELKNIYSTFGIHRMTEKEKEMKVVAFKPFIKRVLKSGKTKIANKKIVDVIDFRKKNVPLIKICLNDGSWIVINTENTDNKISYSIQIIGAKTESLMDIVSFEKDVESWIEDNSESLEKKTFNWKVFLKYSIFLSGVIGIFLIVFFTIYSGSQSVQGASGISTYSMASLIFNSENRWIWLSMWLWRAFSAAISAWATKRSLQMQGQKSRLIDLYIAATMSWVVSFVTPFMVGGDAVAYWYMRRRGIKRSALITSYMTDTLLNQGKYFLQTIILFGVGVGMYKQIFLSGDPQAHAALIMFFVGLSWMVFSTFMIFIILLNRRFQEFIVRNSVKFLEWTRFVVLVDPGKLSASTMYEFKMVREGTKVIWKHKFYPFEMIVYSLIPMFVNPGAIMLWDAGWINNNLSGGWYLGQLVAGDIAGTANSMSITPGGAGTGEWLSININKIVFENSDQTAIHQSLSGNEIASGSDLMWKIFFGWPQLVFSSILTCSMVFVENRRKAIKNINKNRVLKNQEKRAGTRSLHFVIVILVLYIICLVLYHLFLIF